MPASVESAESGVEPGVVTPETLVKSQFLDVDTSDIVMSVVESTWSGVVTPEMPIKFSVVWIDNGSTLSPPVVTTDSSHCFLGQA